MFYPTFGHQLPSSESVETVTITLERYEDLKMRVESLEGIESCYTIEERPEERIATVDIQKLKRFIERKEKNGHGILFSLKKVKVFLENGESI